MVWIVSLVQNAFAQTLMVFVLIFAMIFGILQKSKLFGESKGQVDALIALSIALIVVSVSYALDIITRLIPFLAIGLVVVLSFILLIGLFYKDKFEPEENMRYAVIVLGALVLLFALLYITGAWDYLVNLWNDPNSDVIGNVVIILIMIGLFALVWFGKDKK